MREICICAAVKCEDGLIIRGHRHSDCIRNIEGRPDKDSRLPVLQTQQGFITSMNRFVDRIEGAKLQRRSIIGYEFQEGDILTSEDLY